MKRFLTIVRAHDWWEYKFPPMLAVVYMILQNSSYTFLNVLPLITVATGAIILGAMYASLLNDATDLEEDARAGKKNGMAGFKTYQQIILVLLPLIASFFIISSFLHLSTLAILLYMAAYISFTLYSLPPFRLKKRGLAGIAADALGSQVFPTLFLAVCLYQQTKQEIPLSAFVFLGIWTCCFGLRGILWHQLADKQNDKASGLVTLVQKLNKAQLSRTGIVIVIAELTAFLAYISLTHLFLIIPGLILYFIYNMGLQRRLHVKQILINPSFPQYRIFLFEYYQVFLPLSVLIIYTCKNPVNIAGLFLHCILFRKNAGDIFMSIKQILGNRFTNNFLRTKKNPSN